MHPRKDVFKNVPSHLKVEHIGTTRPKEIKLICTMTLSEPKLRNWHNNSEGKLHTLIFLHFFQGCSLKCFNCHHTKQWDYCERRRYEISCQNTTRTTCYRLETHDSSGSHFSLGCLNFKLCNRTTLCSNTVKCEVRSSVSPTVIA